jgi:N-acetylglucosamine-6-phosphate deacetylase
MLDEEGAALLGVHLEGPFIAPEKIGAHEERYAQLPNAALIQKWQTLSQDAIKLITLAPELQGALAFIETLREMNIVVSLGHTHATYEQTLAAIDAGSTQATHLFNAMRGIHQREPGAVSALLLSDRVMTELIVDGIHLHPAIVRMAFHLKRKERILLVTDAIRAKCLGDGQYKLGEQRVNVREGRASLAEGRLAGSVLRMPQAIRNMMQFTECSLEDAINMASLNPACVLGLQHRKGSVERGKDADLIVMNAHFEVVLTMRAGKEIFKA